MSYSSLYLKSRSKIKPYYYVVACLVFVIFIITVIFITKSKPAIRSKQSLKRFEITNLSPNQVSIFWQTEGKKTGWLIWGDNPDKLNKVIYDDRDIPTKTSSYLNHYVTLRDLKENSTYFFKIIADNQEIVGSDSNAFSFITPQSHSNFNKLIPAYGKVVQSNSSPQENAIVILTIPNMYSLSALTKSTGEWLIPLNNFYEKQSLKTKSLDVKSQVNIEIVNEEGVASFITTSLDSLSSLPQTVVIGKNLSYKNESDVLSASTSNGDSGEDVPKNKEIDILYPKENALIPGKSPLIKGIALPNKEVIILIESKINTSSKVTADKEGIWRLTLINELPPGVCKITILTNDRQNKEVKIERKFSIAKSGEQVLGEATVEAQPTVTETPVPTEEVLPTETPYIAPTYPVATNTTVPMTTEPVSGSNFNGFMLASASFIVIGLGILLAF